MRKKNIFQYKLDHSLEERQNESSRILSTYQNRLPIICENEESLTSQKYFSDKSSCLSKYLNNKSISSIVIRAILIPPTKFYYNIKK